MFKIHTSITAVNKEVRLNAKNVVVNRKTKLLELVVVPTENLKQVKYLKNEILCVGQIEKALKDQIAETELKLRA